MTPLVQETLELKRETIDQYVDGIIEFLKLHRVETLLIIGANNKEGMTELLDKAMETIFDFEKEKASFSLRLLMNREEMIETERQISKMVADLPFRVMSRIHEALGITG